MPLWRALAFAGLCLASQHVCAQSLDFAHRTITIYIGNTPGGSYDLYGRLVARHLGRFLPGNPAVIAENMPGAGTLKAANFLYSVAPKDGTALGLVTETLALEQALETVGVQFDARRFSWIGRVATSNNIHLQWSTSKVQSIEDARKYETPVAGTGAGNIAEAVPRLLNSVMGTKFKIISGYPASNESLLAMERGEVEGTATSWAAMKTSRAAWLRDKQVKIILQDVPERSPDLPDVPALGELGSTPEEHQLLGLYASGGAIGRSILGPPGIPAPVLQLLQQGFMAMTRDRDFIDDVTKLGVDFEPAPAETIQDAVNRTLNVPKEILLRAKAAYAPQ